MEQIGLKKNATNTKKNKNKNKKPLISSTTDFFFGLLQAKMLEFEMLKLFQNL